MQVDERSQQFCGIDLMSERFTKEKFMDKTLADLKETCRRHRLKVSGNKSELAARLLHHQQELLRGEDSERSEAAQLDMESDTGLPRDVRAVREYLTLNVREKLRLKQLAQDSVCPKCLEGPMAARRARFGGVFLGCKDYKEKACRGAVPWQDVIQKATEPEGMTWTASR